MESVTFFVVKLALNDSIGNLWDVTPYSLVDSNVLHRNATYLKHYTVSRHRNSDLIYRTLYIDVCIISALQLCKHVFIRGGTR
jgi:hypothetical protein